MIPYFHGHTSSVSFYCAIKSCCFLDVARTNNNEEHRVFLDHGTQAYLSIVIYLFFQIFWRRSWSATALPDVSPDSRLGEPCPLLEVSWLLAAVLYADFLHHLQQHSNTNCTIDARRTISFLWAISQDLNLTWMELCDRPSHTPELCPADAHSFCVMNIVVAMLCVKLEGGRTAAMGF